MKKISYFGLLTIVSFGFLTGCGQENTITCKSFSDQSISGYEINTEYNISYDGDIVNKVEITEVVESKNKTILSYFEEKNKEQYKENNIKYRGYSYKITNENNKLVSKITIDYSKVDLDTFIKDNPAMKNFVNKDNKLTIDGVKAMYESIGATCK